MLALTFSSSKETELTPQFVSKTCDQLLTFFFAGHDSTGVLLSWIFYELSCCPRAKDRVRKELDELFGRDTRPEIVQEVLRSEAGPKLVREMTYISAVVKETLRLHPPASTARYVPPGEGFTVLDLSSGEEKYCLDDTIMVNCHRILQRDEAVYGDSAEDFFPERWLDAAKGYPASAWRPFERGPRNCIGQELALLEARVVVAVLARHFDFTKVGLGAVERDDRGRVVVDERGMYQITAKPVDGMMMQLPIFLVADLIGDKPSVTITCATQSVSPQQQSLLAFSLQSALEIILLRPQTILRDVRPFTVLDHQLLSLWNEKLLLAVSALVQDLISQVASKRPDVRAICSWDGNLTYAELEVLSSQLAHLLRRNAVKRHDMVALCFDKSLWAVVSMMAVLKAGAAFLSVDPTYPQERRNIILEIAKANLMLVPKELDPMKLGIGIPYSSVSREALESMPLDVDGSEQCNPSDIAYCVFTSGSTGQPKGITVEHSALCTSVEQQARAMDIDGGSRVLQFAAYSFDVSIGDIFATLTAGACLCIPSESERTDDLCRAMARMNVTHACLTSTVAGTLDPESVASLKVLTVGGEPMAKQMITNWAHTLKLNNIYGPAECAVWCFMRPNVGLRDCESNIGFGLASRAWIVHPDNHHHLLPVGAIGELLVEGPLLARGYVNDPKKTGAAFITDPEWVRWFGPGRGRRMYKTGDLVRYRAEDGSLIFISRKDNQAKIRGQRIELLEIEFHLKRVMDSKQHAIVDIIWPRDSEHAVLAAFVSMAMNPWITRDKKVLSFEAQQLLEKLKTHAKPELAKVLPSYMLPAVFIPVDAIPLNSSAKTDRKALRRECANFSWHELSQLFGSASRDTITTNRTAILEIPMSDAETMLAKCWAQVLGISGTTVRTTDNFFALGGDSLKAIHLAGAYRRQGASLKVADMMQYPELKNMATRVMPLEDVSSSAQLNASSKQGTIFSDADSGLEDAAEQTGVPKEAIRAIYPCTPLQQEMMELSLQGQPHHFAHELCRLWPTLDVERFKRAWGDVFDLHPILRSRFFRAKQDGCMRQAIVDEKLHWGSATDFDSYMSQHFGQTLRLGERLARWTLYQEDSSAENGGTGVNMLIVSIHHSLFDGITLQRIFGDLYAAYKGQALCQTLPSFGAYLHHMKIVSQNRAAQRREFWTKYLASWRDASTFPPMTGPAYLPNASKGTMRFQPFESERPALGNLTLSTIIRASWALKLSGLADSQIIVFSTFLAARNADILGVEELAAPTFAHVPILARILPNETVREFLARLQSEAIDMIPHENTGMKTIYETCRVDRDLIRNLLVIQPMPGGGGRPPSMPGENRIFPGAILSGPRADPGAMGAFTPYPLLMECVMLDSGIAFRVSFDDEILSREFIDRLLDDFAQISQTLPKALDQLVSDYLSALAR
ncbi:Amino acid adenylation [Metarhizium rileyi]|uniref:Amino acid adenylation n=1 Tax=Metarhizium rileyi (strain RCEF 4871) TaxID=1649241 RepID=A0A167C2Z7_METRR|nr:Amino acid adenylation [Metarhizium rileyi RCEF 4871]